MKLLDKLSVIFNRKSKGALADITGAIDGSLDTMRNDLNDLELEYVVSTATGEWLDAWGEWFSTTRNFNETDYQYSRRILRNATFIRNTIPALKSAVKMVLGDDTNVEIDEMYNYLRVWGSSTFDNSGVYSDEDTYRIGVVQITIDKPVTNELVNELLSFKAAGIKLRYVYDTSLGGQNMVDFSSVDDQTIGLTTVYSYGSINYSPTSSFDSTGTPRYSGSQTIWSNIAD